MTQQKNFYTLTEAANILRIDKATMRKLINAGEVKAIRVGRQWRIPIAAFRQYAGLPPEEEGNR